MPRSSAQDEEAATEHMHAINRLGQKVAAVLFLEDLCNEGETTFMQVNSKGAILPPKDVDPNSTRQAKLAMEAARDNAEVIFSFFLSKLLTVSSDVYILSVLRRLEAQVELAATALLAAICLRHVCTT